MELHHNSHNIFTHSVVSSERDKSKDTHGFKFSHRYLANAFADSSQILLFAKSKANQGCKFSHRSFASSFTQ